MTPAPDPLGNPSSPDPNIADMLKRFHQALGAAEAETRINGLSEEQFLDVLHRVLKAIHGSAINRGYTRSVFYSCTVDLPVGLDSSWSQVLVRCLGLLRALNGSESPRFWSVATTWSSSRCR